MNNNEYELNDKYIISKMKNNAFYAPCKFYSPYLKRGVVIPKVVLDTGCAATHISANLFIGINYEQSKDRYDNIIKAMKEWKLKDIHNKTAYSVGFGVEGKAKNIIRPTKHEDILNSKYVRFMHNVNSFRIGDYRIGECNIVISYDTVDVALIGMSILKDFDIHIGRDKSGNTVLIGCKLDDMNKDYLRALETKFRLGSKILEADIFNDEH